MPLSQLNGIFVSIFIKNEVYNNLLLYGFIVIVAGLSDATQWIL